MGRWRPALGPRRGETRRSVRFARERPAVVEQPGDLTAALDHRARSQPMTQSVLVPKRRTGERPMHPAHRLASDCLAAAPPFRPLGMRRALLHGIDRHRRECITKGAFAELRAACVRRGGPLTGEFLDLEREIDSFGCLVGKTCQRASLGPRKVAFGRRSYCPRLLRTSAKFHGWSPRIYSPSNTASHFALPTQSVAGTTTSRQSKSSPTCAVGGRISQFCAKWCESNQVVRTKARPFWACSDDLRA